MPSIGFSCGASIRRASRKVSSPATKTRSTSGSVSAFSSESRSRCKSQWALKAGARLKTTARFSRRPASSFWMHSIHRSTAAQGPSSTKPTIYTWVLDFPDPTPESRRFECGCVQPVVPNRFNPAIASQKHDFAISRSARRSARRSASWTVVALAAVSPEPGIHPPTVSSGAVSDAVMSFPR